MDSRFTFKDFVFVVLFVVVAGAVGWASWQFGYQEKRLNDVREDLQKLDATQKQQLGVLHEIRNALKNGVTVAGGGSGAETQGAVKGERIRRKEPDGGLYVFYPDIPKYPRDSMSQPDYATGDWLIQNLGAEPKVIAPLIEKDMQGQKVHVPVLETLASQNPMTMEWEPYLCDWFRVSGDGLKLTFHLRSRACFSDGAPVTVEDVIFSFNTLMEDGVDAASLRSYYDGVTVKRVDNETVEFDRKEPYFLALEFIGGGIPIIPEHVYRHKTGEGFNKMGDVLVATGPYVLPKGGWERGQKITMVRNEKYWGYRPNFDKIIFLFIGDSQAQMQSFLNEQVDVLADPIPPDAEEFLKYSNDAEFLKKFRAIRFSRPNAMYMYMGWNQEKDLFKDRETRQALTMLVDRRAIIDKLLKGFGEEMTGPFKKGTKQNDDTIKPIPFDVEGAKKKLAEAGWKAGADGVLERGGRRFEFDLSFRSGVPIRERIATYVQQQFQQAGIRMRLTPFEASVLIANLDDHKFDACLAGWGGSGAEEDPNQIWSSKSIPDKGSNHVSFRNAESDRLIEEGRQTIDDDKRMEIWHRFQKVAYDEQPYMWLFAEADCAFVNGRIKNAEPYPLGLVEYDVDWYVPAGAQKYK